MLCYSQVIGSFIPCGSHRANICKGLKPHSSSVDVYHIWQQENSYFSIKPTDALVSKFILVQSSTCFGSSSIHHQELATVHSSLAHVIQVWRQLACRIRMELCSILILYASCRHTCITCASAECTVANSWWWVEELPKHVEFCTRINLETSASVGFIEK